MKLATNTLGFHCGIQWVAVAGSPNFKKVLVTFLCNHRNVAHNLDPLGMNNLLGQSHVQ